MLRRTPGTRLLAGGTDLLVAMRASRARPPAMVSIGRVPELLGWRTHDASVDMGAGVTLTELAGAEIGAVIPALARAARSVASPQIRNAATLGGNLATAAPTSDLIPVLAALEATMSVGGPDSRREVRIGADGAALGPGDVVLSVRVPASRGVQTYLRTGARRGMALPLAAVALVIDFDERAVRCAVAGGGRAVEAERWVAGHIDWRDGRVPDPRTYEGFGQFVADRAEIFPSNQASTSYQRHALDVLATRALMELV